MKCVYAAFAVLLVASLHAQNPGCDGLRFKTEAFADVKRTTVTYGQATKTISAPNAKSWLAGDMWL